MCYQQAGLSDSDRQAWLCRLELVRLQSDYACRTAHAMLEPVTIYLRTSA
jgi:hypothetical protein